ncbi:hypothetical protein MC885_015289, partial [Smutsia gigantea]
MKGKRRRGWLQATRRRGLPGGAGLAPRRCTSEQPEAANHLTKACDCRAPAVGKELGQGPSEWYFALSERGRVPGDLDETRRR